MTQTFMKRTTIIVNNNKYKYIIYAYLLSERGGRQYFRTWSHHKNINKSTTAIYKLIYICKNVNNFIILKHNMTYMYMHFST
jgi:hypothetical protein